MKEDDFSPITIRVAHCIREGIYSGRWTEHLPGRVMLARELGVSPSTTARAIALLMQEGLLESRGANRRARIKPIEKKKAGGPSTLKIGMIPYSTQHMAELPWLAIQYEIRLHGMEPRVSPFTLEDAKFELPRLKKMVGESKPDAWLIMGGTKPILQWFSEQDTPAFALAGGILNLNIAGTGFDLSDATRAATRRLIELGHTRIVMINKLGTIQNQDSGLTHAFLEEMKAHGINTSSYNLPELGHSPTPTQIRDFLKNLFRYTPPTALMVNVPLTYHVTKEFLLETGRKIPGDVSLVVQHTLPGFESDKPSPSYFEFDHLAMVEPFIKWAKKLRHNENSRKQFSIQATFVEGDSIGPARRS